MAPKKRLLFLSYGEDLLQNKILQNQFASFAKNFDTAKYDVHVHSVFPISRTRLFANSQWRQNLRSLRASFLDRNALFSYSTLPALASWLYSNFIQFFLFHHVYYHLKLAIYIKRHGIQYVYCRGYHAAFAANIIKKYFNKDLKVHFDPRGMFIEEGLWRGKLGFLSLKLWRKVERFIYSNSDLVTFVSEPFEKQLNQNYKIKNSMVIYTHADLEKFLNNKTLSLSPLRFCYLGQLDEVGWHQTKYLLALFKTLSQNFDAQFLIITQSNHDHIRLQAEEMGLTANMVIAKAQNTQEVAKLLEPCHFAVMSYRPSTSHIEESLAVSVVASKSGEYLAAGLPMICNRQLRGIVDLLERYDVGVTYDIGHESKVIGDIKTILSNYSSVSAKCREVAKNHFDIKKNIQLLEKEIEKLCAP